MVAIADREGGAEATIRVARDFGGTDFDPNLVDAWCAAASEILDGVDLEATWEQVVNEQPPRRGPLTEAELDAALELLADYADLKSPWFTGHSRAVASLATAAAREAHLPETDVTMLRRAALVHALGRQS